MRHLSLRVFGFLRISQLCYPALPSPLLRARLAFNCITVEPVVFYHRLYLFSNSVSFSLAAADSDTSTVITLNSKKSKNHVTHLLSATDQHWKFDQYRY
jgi:hypothetical protein